MPISWARVIGWCDIATSVGVRAAQHNRSMRSFVAILLALCFLAAATGLPYPGRTARRTGAEDYPCRHHTCGCRTARMCRLHCCCFPRRPLADPRHDAGFSSPAAHLGHRGQPVHRIPREQEARHTSATSQYAYSFSAVKCAGTTWTLVFAGRLYLARFRTAVRGIPPLSGVVKLRLLAMAPLYHISPPTPPPRYADALFSVRSL